MYVDYLCYVFCHYFIFFCFFFFQAEDGIRDKLVTGVQTCALPICWRKVREAVSSWGAGNLAKAILKARWIWWVGSWPASRRRRWAKCWDSSRANWPLRRVRAWGATVVEGRAAQDWFMGAASKTSTSGMVRERRWKV